ncbi:MAG: SAM-dependent chlorinase/fluorinase [Saprospiraceae bacterium]|nr:SAM-dependent chlorinase/fluorinase [Saprospiraceae bacterium]
MQLISLITDYGSTDYYSAELKAALYKNCEHIRILDVTHSVRVYDISLAAYHLKNILASLPKESINIISVNNYYDRNPVYLVFENEGMYFIGPDNGVFSMVFDDLQNVHTIDLSTLTGRQVHQIYAHAAACIHHGLPLDEFSVPVTEYNSRISFRPVVTGNQIKATIIHVDQYENVITNLSKELFEKSRDGRAFSIYYKPNEPIEMLSRHYGEVGHGETLAWFNSANLLEIAINMGQASSTLHLFANETIQIDFH